MLILCWSLYVDYCIQVAWQSNKVTCSNFHLTEKKIGTERLGNFPTFIQLSNGRDHTWTLAIILLKFISFITLQLFFTHSEWFSPECFLFSWLDSSLLTALSSYRGQSTILRLKVKREVWPLFPTSSFKGFPWDTFITWEKKVPL